jgi:hypothetical protein
VVKYDWHFIHTHTIFIQMHLLLVLCAAVGVFASCASAELLGCLPCTQNICQQNSQVSLYENGVCVFDANVGHKNVFYTGHVFGLGVCPAVQLKVGADCYHNMAAEIAHQLSSAPAIGDTLFDPQAECYIMPENTVCSFSTEKFVFQTRGYNCAAIKILADNAVEGCVRHLADGRFWASVFYFLAIVIGLALIALCCTCTFTA